MIKGPLFRDQMYKTQEAEDSDIFVPLPRVRAGASHCSQEQVPAPVAESRRLRILIVEDNPDDAELLQVQLRLWATDFEIVCVDRLSQAVARLAECRFGLVLLDLGLPDSQGLDSFLEIQRIASDIPIVVLTGNADPELGTRALDAGAQDFLPKGTEAAWLARAIWYATERNKLQRRLERALVKSRVSEANLRTIVDKNVDGIVIADARNVVLHANVAAEILFGHASGELTGSTLGFPAAVGETREIFIARASGQTVPVEIRASEIEWEKKPAVMLVLHDLSDRKRVESIRVKMRLAREVQQNLLPTVVPQLPGFEIAGASISADETGGDYYDYIRMPGNALGLVVADASGHGYGPALLIAEVSAFLRAYASIQCDAGTVLSLLNRSLLEQREEISHFVTAIFVRIDMDSRTFTFANSGHPAGILLGAKGEVRMKLGSVDPPIMLMPDLEFRSSPEIPFETGDLLVLISDGFVEAYGASHTLFGLPKVVDLIRRHQQQPPREIVEALCHAVLEHCAPASLPDDVTVVAVKITN